MNISSSSRDRQCWGSISKPQTADFFFSPLPCIFFNGFFFFFLAQPPFFIFLCYNTVILFNSTPDDQLMAEDVEDVVAFRWAFD